MTDGRVEAIDIGPVAAGPLGEVPEVRTRGVCLHRGVRRAGIPSGIIRPGDPVREVTDRAEAPAS